MGVAFSFSKRLPVYGISFMRILLTGGTGFIGSHTAALLLEAGHDVVLYDNLSNSRAEVVDRLERITGRRPVLVVGDIRDEEAMRRALHEHRIEAVIHFAGLKAVGESVEKPLEYYDNNIVGTLRLLEAMRAEGVKSLIFSSSSTVYGTPKSLPLTEEMPTGEATNPYGRTKLHIEQILADCAKADPELRVVCLRYFNPIGRILQDSSAKIPTAFRTISCPTWPASRTDAFPRCASSATTTRRPTARACATTSTSWTSPKGT